MTHSQTIEIAVGFSCGVQGADKRDVLEVEATATDEEIEAEVREWMWNFVETWWERKA